jgi:hypothetical protein
LTIPVRLKRLEGSFTASFPAIIDTGAPLSLFNLSPEQLGISEYVEHVMYGVVRKEECQIPVKIAPVSLVLEDAAGMSSPELTILAAFSTLEVGVNLLGLFGMLDIASWVFDPEEESLRVTFDFSRNALDDARPSTPSEL